MVAVPETNQESLSAARAVGLEKVDYAESMSMKRVMMSTGIASTA